MTSSIKNRRSSKPKSQQSSADSDSSSSSSKQPPSKYDRSAHSSTATVVLALVLAGLLLLSLSSLLPSTKNTQAQTRKAVARTNGLRSKAQPFSPFSTPLANMDRASSETPLTGLHPLGEEYLLQNNAASTSEQKRGLVTGSIQFPHVDLSSVLTEEASQPTNQRLMMNFGQGLLGKGNNPASDLFEDSFLGYDSKFESVIAAEHRVYDDHALLTRCGYKMGKVPNQDRSLIANFFLDANGGQSKRDGQALLMGIFDGHGPRGHEVSHYIALELPRIFAKIMRQKGNSLPQPLLDSLGSPQMEYLVVNYIKRALIETFLTVDETEPVKGSGGSTASTLFYPGLGPKVYIANAGDSTTLIVMYKKSSKRSTIVVQNRKHKPHLEEERQRIEKAGGQVMIPPSVLRGDSSDGLSETSRVVIPGPGGNSFGSLALAMSRSIGDFDGKSVGIIAEPDVIPWDVNEFYKKNHFSQEQIDDTTWFAVVASDGVYDVLRPDIVVEYLGRSLHHDRTTSMNVSPLEACERIIREASRLWMKASMGGMPYRDDITIGVSKIIFASL